MEILEIYEIFYGVIFNLDNKMMPPGVGCVALRWIKNLAVFRKCHGKQFSFHTKQVKSVEIALVPNKN